MAGIGNGIVLRPGMRVGLLGGSFDPPHAGHVHISHEALRRFDLDLVIWLVSPGNPLKPNPPAALDRRMAQAHLLCHHPKIRPSDFEARAGTCYTADALDTLRDRFGRVQFVWLMGADNLAGFHRWKDWASIMQNVPVGVLARPDDRLAVLNARAAQRYRQVRLPQFKARMLGRTPGPQWCYLTIPLRSESSTAIRASGQWDA